MNDGKMLRSRQLLGDKNGFVEGIEVKDTIDEWLNMMWIQFGQEVENHFETDAAFKLI